MMAAAFMMVEAAVLQPLGRYGLRVLLEMHGRAVGDLEGPTTSSVFLDDGPPSAPVLHDVVHLHLIFSVIHYRCPLVRILNYNLLILGLG